MALKVGDRIPQASLLQMKDGGVQAVDTGQFFKGRTVALFAVPGAFTPTCSAKHVPSFLQNVEALKAKGVDAIACISVNDPFVMQAWEEQTGATGKITMLADADGAFTRAAGLEVDLNRAGLGVRSRRYSALVRDGVVQHLNLEEAGGFGVSSGDYLLKQI